MSDKLWKKSEKGLKGLKVTVMGLGLNGGNLAACLFLASRGAELIVTDLRSAEVLKPSLDQLAGFDIRYVLGEHRMEDFIRADMIIKNPAVPKSSPFLQGGVPVETDVSLFLRYAVNPVLAVTGTKGKSTTVTALHHIMKGAFPDVRLGGNITRSPLFFKDELTGNEPIILELSSWQLGDLRGKGLLKPEISLITNILHDHQNSYASMDDYIADKEEIFLSQDKGQTALFPLNERGLKWKSMAKAQSVFFSLEGKKEGALVWLDEEGGHIRLDGVEQLLIPPELAVPGKHVRGNVLLAAAMAVLYGMDKESIYAGAQSFPGVPHRMEKVGTSGGVTYYNDTAATIPDALMAALHSFPKPPLLICGGSDKELDLSPLADLKGRAKGVFLLEGSATERMIPYVEKSGIPYWGPYSSLKEAFDSARRQSEPGDTVIMSPGATSFGMFLNEFDRGDQFRELFKGLS